MRKEIRQVDEQKNIVQITTVGERWYSRLISVDGTATNKRWQFVPSTSWVASFFPKDVRFFKYLASKGWSEAEEYKAMRGTQGSKVHQAIKALLEGAEVKMSDSFTNPDTLKDEELDNEEWLCIMSFVDWFKSEQAILQLGYKKNKHKKWKFTPIKDQFNLFLAVRKIWARETAGIQPLQRDYPLSLSLGIAKAANG